MDVILAIIGIAFLWSVFQLISTRKASIELQNIIQTGISSPRYFFLIIYLNQYLANFNI